MDRILTCYRKIVVASDLPSEQKASLLALIKKGDWRALQARRLQHPKNYSSPHAYFTDAVVTEFLRKLRIPGDNKARRAAAVATFYASERQNADTNARLARFVDNKGPFRPDDVQRCVIFMRWRAELARALGKPPVLAPSYSGGSTLSDKGSLTTIPDKMSSRPTLYAHSCDVMKQFLPGTELDKVGSFVRGNRFFTVPKDSEKDRGCCVEASQNISLQLALGRVMKERYLRAYGVDLTHAQPLHQQAAQRASVDGEHATIDLSNASDTLARNLVRLVLPRGWLVLLESLRATHTEIDGSWVYLEKFSSMGNGFTFELETFIFRSLVAVLGDQADDTRLVFGDDIVVPTREARALLDWLRYVGFTPNEKKTFCEGPFRESCGGDFFAGAPVRAHYVKEVPCEPHQWIAVANGIRRVDPSLETYRAAWRYAVDQIPTPARVFGPSEFGDQVICDPSATPSRVFSRTHGCVLPFWTVWRPIARSYKLEQHWKPDVVMACALMGLGPDITPRASVLGYKRSRVIGWGLNLEGAELTGFINRIGSGLSRTLVNTA